MNPICITSTALRKRSKHYPARFNDKVPWMVRMLERVRPDFPPVSKPGTVALCGHVYECVTNQHGAVSVICPNGELLGVKPDEFEVVQFFGRWQSVVEWPKGMALAQSTDTHDTLEQAEAVIDIIKRDGMGGEGKIFPVRTWVKPVDDSRLLREMERLLTMPNMFPETKALIEKAIAAQKGK